MSEPFLERLSRFTPDAGRLDRDALLFAAGRGSARPNRGWMTLATILASTQALSLVLLWPRPTLPERGMSAAVAVAPVPSPPATLQPGTAEAVAGRGAWTVRQRLLEAAADNLPDDTITLIDSGPPLRVFGRPPSSLLN